MHIYADVMLGINFIMNTAILFLTGRVTGTPCQVMRMGGAALTGSIYALGGVFPELQLLYSPVGKIVASGIIVLFAFGRPQRSRIFFLRLGVFYLSSLAVGGAVLGWMFFWKNGGLAAGEWALPYLGWETLFWGGTCGIVLAIVTVRWLVIRRRRQNLCLPIRIEFQQRQVQVTALLDTGNCLYTVGGLAPVMLVAYQAVSPLLSREVCAFLNVTPQGDWLHQLHRCSDREWLARVQIIPCRTVTGDELILGFRPDRIVLCQGAKEAMIDHLVVGMIQKQLSGADGYQALLHPDVMEKMNIRVEERVCAKSGCC